MGRGKMGRAYPVLGGAVQRVCLERVQAHHAGRDDHAALAAGPSLRGVRVGAVAREGDEELQPADHGAEVHVQGLEVRWLDDQTVCRIAVPLCACSSSVAGRDRDLGAEHVLAVVDARVRGEDVHVAAVGVRALEERQLRGEGGDVRGDEGRGRGGRRGEWEGGCGEEAGRVDVGHEDFVVLREEVGAQGQADAGCGAGDDGDGVWRWGCSGGHGCWGGGGKGGDDGDRDGWCWWKRGRGIDARVGEWVRGMVVAWRSAGGER